MSKISKDGQLVGDDLAGSRDMNLDQVVTESSLPAPTQYRIHYSGRLGRTINTESGRVVYAVISVPRLIIRATETANIFEKELELNEGDVAICFGVDAQEEGLAAGKVGLWEGIRVIILNQIALTHPQASLIVIAEDDMRVCSTIMQKGRWKQMLHSVFSNARPICMLGFCVNQQSRSYGNRRPTNGTQLWSIRASFAQDFTRIMGEMAPMHFDLALIEKLHYLVCHATHSVAGYTKHVTDCADPDDMGIDSDGQRDQMEVKLNYHLLREMDVVRMHP